jgi:hypothetical protein
LIREATSVRFELFAPNFIGQLMTGNEFLGQTEGLFDGVMLQPCLFELAPTLPEDLIELRKLIITVDPFKPSIGKHAHRQRPRNKLQLSLGVDRSAL